MGCSPIQDGWNILNFAIVFILLMGFFIKQLDMISITYPLRWVGSPDGKRGICLAPRKEKRNRSIGGREAMRRKGSGNGQEASLRGTSHRALRLVHVCMAVEPLARIIKVILQSMPDLANVMALILFFMLVSIFQTQPVSFPEYSL